MDYTSEGIIALRTTLGLSREEFAKELGFLPQTIQSWENGKKTPGPRARSAMEYLADSKMADSKVWPLKATLDHFDLVELTDKELKLLHQTLKDRYYAAWREMDKRKRAKEAERYREEKQTMQIYGG